MVAIARAAWGGAVLAMVFAGAHLGCARKDGGVASALEGPARERAPSTIMDGPAARALPGEEPVIKAQMERIEAELAGLDRGRGGWAAEWAGHYYEGDGLGENVGIYLAPREGIAYLNYGCLGLYGGDRGEVVGTYADGLKLRLKFGISGDSFLTERVYFVRWGNRRYLVPSQKMLDIVNDYNCGGTLRGAMVGIPRLERGGEPNPRFEMERPAGRPELPAEFARLLRDEPVRLRATKVETVAGVTDVTGAPVGVYRVEFEGGLADGAYEGMEFYYPRSFRGGIGAATVKHAAERTCWAEIRSYGIEGTKYVPPKVGEVLVARFEEQAEGHPTTRP